MILTIRPATDADASFMAPRLRPEDAREISTASGMDCKSILSLSVASARESYSIRLTDETGGIDREPSVLFGIADDTGRPGFGVMWLVATPRVQRAPFSVLREAAHWLDAWCQRYPQGIHNIVDTRNATHIRWMRGLGFRVSDQTIDINGSRFKYAWRGPQE
jgi:hypothetical protein